jgi:uncharacterized protein YcbK (DUF882 family)
MKWFYSFVGILSALVGLLATGSGLAAEGPMDPFFLMGDGWVHIRNVQNNLEIKVNLLNADGSINDSALSQVDAVFGFSTKDQGEHISPRLLFMLDYFSDLVAPGKMIHLHSGYRNPEYNNKLKQAGLTVAKTSLHMDGMALDFSLEGVKGRDLWEIVRQKNCCGIGHYGGEIVHLDAGRPRFWAAATAGVTTGQSDYNRRIYLSTEFDRYAPGQKVRLHLAAVSNYGFGIRPEAALVSYPAGERTVARLQILAPASSECLPIDTRKQARFIYLNLPVDLAPGRYRFRLEFCHRPFEEMPVQTVSNDIEVR